MPKIAGLTTPKYRKHRATGQAVVTISGRDIYLGPWKSKASRIEYDRLIGEWLAAGRPTTIATATDITIGELLKRYKVHAERHYRKDGQPTQEVKNIGYAVKPVRELYGHLAAIEFGPLALKAIQQRFIADGVCRDQINQRIGKIKRVFKWGVSEQLIPPSVFQALQAVDGLRYGRTEAKERPPVQPVDNATVDATLPHLSPVVADMVRFQRLTGCRPGEVCILRPCDVDTTADPWVYRPSSHKTQHHGRERRIFVGPQAQDVLRPYLLRDKQSLCFQPAESERKRRTIVHEQRKTPLHYGNRPGTNLKRKPKRKAGEQYNKDAYNRAIRRACEKASIPNWHANQLRHNVATLLRSKYGLDAAQTVLGHADPKITLTYAEADFAKAALIMKEVG